MSISRAMGDWLGDTLDAALYMADAMEKAREAPAMVARQIHAYALGVTDETGRLLEEISRKGRRAATMGRGPTAAPPVPPSCNTGGKVPPSRGKASPK
jgi:hypothetical protein